MRRRLREAPGPYTAAFSHPDPMDPNDRVKNSPQSRSSEFPYDRAVSYGDPLGTSMQGSSYIKPPDGARPIPRNRRPEDVEPISAWEEAGCAVGIGGHQDPLWDDLEVDPSLAAIFGEIPSPEDERDGLGSLISLLGGMGMDVELSSGEYLPARRGKYGDGHVYAPGAEEDE